MQRKGRQQRLSYPFPIPLRAVRFEYVPQVFNAEHVGRYLAVRVESRFRPFWPMTTRHLPPHPHALSTYIRPFPTVSHKNRVLFMRHTNASSPPLRTRLGNQHAQYKM